MAKIEEIFKETFVGVIVTRIEMKEPGEDEKLKELSVLMTGSISEGLVDSKKLSMIKVLNDSQTNEKLTKYLTRPGDVVVKITSPYDAVCITEKTKGLLIPSYCMVLRGISKDVDADYITGYLNTDYAKKEMFAGTDSSKTAMLKPSMIRSAEVPLLTIEQQRKIGRLYSINCEKRMVLQQMLGIEREIGKSLIMEAIGGK